MLPFSGLGTGMWECGSCVSWVCWPPRKLVAPISAAQPSLLPTILLAARLKLGLSATAASECGQSNAEEY